MGKLIQFELRKLFRMKSVYICLSVLVGLIFIGILSIYWLSSLTGQMQAEIPEEVTALLKKNSSYFLMTGVSMPNLDILLAIVISLFVCMDYHLGAMKTIVARGYDRTRIFFAKYITALILAACYALISMFIAFLLGGVFFSFSGTITSTMLLALLLQLLTILAYTTFFFCLASLMKKTGGTIAIGVVAPLVISIIVSLVDTLRRKPKFYISEYWLPNILSSLSNNVVKNDDLIRAGVTGLIYIVVFGALAYVASFRSEV